MAYLSQFLTDSTGIAAPETAWNLFRVPNISPELSELNRKSPVFYKLLEMLPEQPVVDQPRYNWTEDDIPLNYTAINHGGGYGAGAANIDVDDGSIFVTNESVRSMTHGEVMLITNIAGNTLTVTRGWQGSVAAPLDNDEIILRLHYELGDYGVAPDAVGTIPEEKWNYVSGLSRTFDVSEMQNNTNMRWGVGQIPRETIIKAFEIRRDLANQFIYGLRHKGVNNNGKTTYNTNGFYALATQNSLSVAAGALSWATFYNTFEAAFEPTESSSTKLLLCGHTVVQTIANLLYNKVTFSQYETALGQTCSKVVLPSGNIIQIMHDPYTFDTAKGLAGKGILIDTAHIGMRWFKNMGMKWKQNVQNNNVHGRQDEIYCAAGFILKHPELHGTVELT